MAVSVLNMQNGVYRRRRVVNRIMLTVSLLSLIHISSSEKLAASLG